MLFFMRHCALVGLLAVLVACQAPTPLAPASAPDDVRAACSLAERRCSECHDRDRIVEAHKSREEWRATVERMRQMPGSTIRPDETATILRCLLYRTDTSDRMTASPHVAMVWPPTYFFGDSLVLKP